MCLVDSGGGTVVLVNEDGVALTSDISHFVVIILSSSHCICLVDSSGRVELVSQDGTK